MAASRLRLATVVLVAFLLQTTLLADLRPLGVTPELMLLVAIHAGRVGGPERGTWVGFAAGLLYDLQLATPLGLWALTCCLAGWALGTLAENLHRPGGFLWGASTGIASALGVVAVAAIGRLMGQDGMLGTDLLRIAPLVGLVNLVLSPLAGRALRWAQRPSVALRAA